MSDPEHIDIRGWFPPKILNWINLHSTRLGVPDTYLAIPLLVTVAYLSQHSVSTYRLDITEPQEEETREEARFEVPPSDEESENVDNDDDTNLDSDCTYMDFHTEPLILYGVISGESGSNKSASLSIFQHLVDAIPNCNGKDVDHTLDTFSLDGLMSAMMRNSQCALGLYDEMATFDDSLDKGSSKSFERSRFLTLFGGGKWKKNTKTSGDCVLEDPRFNMASFTQPHYLAQFAESNKKNGLFGRFLVTSPEDRFVMMEEKKRLIRKKCKEGNNINMLDILISIYDRCVGNGVEVILSEEAKLLYDDLHDEIVAYRRDHQGSVIEKSIKSKSLGILLRVGGILSLIRNAVCNKDAEVTLYDKIVTGEDMNRANKIVSYCQMNSLSVLGKTAATTPPTNEAQPRRSA